MLSVGRAWVPEREQRVLDAMLVAPVSRSLLMGTKAVALWLHLAVVEALVIPMVFLFFVRGTGWRHLVAVIAVCLLANLCIAVLGSLISAFPVRRARGVLPVLSCRRGPRRLGRRRRDPTRPHRDIDLAEYAATACFSPPMH